MQKEQLTRPNELRQLELANCALPATRNGSGAVTSRPDSLERRHGSLERSPDSSDGCHATLVRSPASFHHLPAYFAQQTSASSLASAATTSQDEEDGTLEASKQLCHSFVNGIDGSSQAEFICYKSDSATHSGTVFMLAYDSDHP